MESLEGMPAEEHSEAAEPIEEDLSLPESKESTPSGKKPYHYDPILPPCRICGTKATGYHFGVITCEACKVRTNKM